MQPADPERGSLSTITDANISAHSISRTDDLAVPRPGRWPIMLEAGAGTLERLGLAGMSCATQSTAGSRLSLTLRAFGEQAAGVATTWSLPQLLLRLGFRLPVDRSIYRRSTRPATRRLPAVSDPPGGVQGCCCSSATAMAASSICPHEGSRRSTHPKSTPLSEPAPSVVSSTHLQSCRPVALNELGRHSPRESTMTRLLEVTQPAFASSPASPTPRPAQHWTELYPRSPPYR